MGRSTSKKADIVIHLIDGTYELFRQFYGQRSYNKGKDKPTGAVVGVLHGILKMIEDGATHVGVATDHVIESFRNELWDDYKTSEGIEPALFHQFHPLEEALTMMGVIVWPMIELEADDGLASAAFLASRDPRVLKICIWTPDKDLAQCVREDRVVQIDRKASVIRDATAIQKKFGVVPELIPDLLALIGDSADGYPGISGMGQASAVKLLNEFGPIQKFPERVLGKKREQALLFKQLATLRTDAKLFTHVDELQWHGPTTGFAKYCTRIKEPKLLERATSLAAKLA